MSSFISYSRQVHPDEFNVAGGSDTCWETVSLQVTEFVLIGSNLNYDFPSQPVVS